LLALAIHRTGNTIETLREEIDQVRLRAGNVLLQGHQDTIAEFMRSGELMVQDATADLPHTDKAGAAFQFIAAIIVASPALGMAQLKTGGASPAVILSGLLLLMAILTNIVSNNNEINLW
jgi:hypothetical protein